jgi:membrane protease YdiL (CAAX protease family)
MIGAWFSDLVRKENIMTNIKEFIKRHAVLTYYALVFAISWGGILILAAPGGIPAPPEQVERLFLFMLLALFAGPSIAGILMNYLVGGRAGLRDLLARLLRWRVSIRWYAAAFLTGPLLVTAILLGLSLFSPAFLPGIVTTDDKLTLLLFGIAWGLVGGGFLEELGWTGFAVPSLRRHYGALTTALIVGILWGVWHFLIAYWAGGSMGAGQWVPYLLGILAFYLGALPAYRVLMVWVYDQTESLLVAMLMHASLSASTLILQPAATGMPFMTWNLILAVALWLVVAAVAVTRRREAFAITAPQAVGVKR